MKAIYTTIGDTTTTETGTRKKNKRIVPVYTTASNTSVSSFASAYIMEEAKRATFRALKTVYQRSGDSTIYQLLKECAEVLGDNTIDFENFIMNEKGYSSVVTAKKHNRMKDEYTGKMIACRETTTFEYQPAVSRH